MNDIMEQLAGFGVIPVVVIRKKEDAKPLAQALIRGGLGCAEVTFRTDAASDAIRIMTESFPEMLVGAGTVISAEQADEAYDAGAKFIVSPGFDEDVVDHCISRGIPVLPGIATPTEALKGLKRGLKYLKFFPAGATGGIDMIRAMAAPFPSLRFVPTGGINAGNLESYLSDKAVAACGGSWMVKSDLIEQGDFRKIEELTEDAVRKVRKIRDEKK